MKTWRQIAFGSRTSLRRSRKASRNTPKGGVSWLHREMVTMFIDTLPFPYYNKVVGNVASSFANQVVVGERIELGIRRGKFSQSSNSVGFAKKLTLEKKKGETNAVLVESVFSKGRGNPISYSTQIHLQGSRPVVAYTNPPPTPYIPPYQARVDVGVAASFDNKRPA
ncbi:hypothetical protein CR513_48736, partial [Mucuna pruriens]